MRRQTRAATASRLALTSRPSATSADSTRDSSGDFDDTSAQSVRPFKRRKTVSSSASLVESYRRLMSSVGGTRSEMQTASIPPARGHTLVYHAPLLLDDRLGPECREALLVWFDSVSHRRAMPWRKPWLNPADFDHQGDDDDDSNRDAALRKALEKRAYEVWISEIMLQQTRVAVVIEYWKRWMHSWPTIHDLAAASPDDVLAAWRGLGYYSRATRIHEAARLAVDDPSLRGLLPSSPRELADKIPGVGRYTAGAISAIVFGRPAPMVDGNVLRVLSRQLGIHANVKTDKAAVELIWAAAEELVNAAALDGHHLAADEDDATAPRAQDIRNDRPGRWGQALMELGSTVCTPRPDCSQCPITSTCRAYHEGIAISQNASATDKVPDIEEMCSVCEPMGGEAEHSKPDKPSNFAAKAGNKKQVTLSAFILKSTPSSKTECKPLKSEVIKVISDHASRFPVKTAKKVVREQETLVCAVVRGDGRFLIHRRPPRGLLAGLWEFPSVNIADEDGGAGDIDPGQRMDMAEAYAVRLVGAKHPVEHVGELGSVPWLFSHIKLTMHVHLFRLRGSHEVGVGGASSGRWSDCVEGESMGTGMRKCWDLVKQAA